MKRKNLLALLLALATALALTLCACGGEDTPPTKEELLETAEEITVYRLEKDFRDNITVAKENYVGKPFVVLGRVLEITEDGCVLYYRDFYSTFNYFIKAKLPVDELKQLEKKDVIRVVGTIADGIETTEEAVYDSTYTKYYITLENAYFVEELTEINGTVHVHITSDPPFTYYRYYIEVPFLEGDSDKIQLYGSSLSEGDEVTIPISELEMDPYGESYKDPFRGTYHVVIDSTSKVKIEPVAG